MRTFPTLAITALLLSPPQAFAATDRSEALQLHASQEAPSPWHALWQALSGTRTEADLRVRVLDTSGRPLRGATVLVGSAKGDPFPGNLLSTDSSGEATFIHDRLRGNPPLTVTATLPGYSTVSLLSNTRNSLEFRLPKLRAQQDFAFLEGKVHGFPPGYGSGTLELGLFLPAFRTESLVNFDPQQFIASYKVKIDVFGEREVPGNVVFPPQKKRYGFVPISIAKPEYIMPLAKGTEAYMSAIVGAVAIGEALDAVKKKDYLAAINLASFTHVGWTSRRVRVDGNERFDLTATEALKPEALTVQMTGLPPKTDAVTVALTDPAGEAEDFVAMDVKAAKSEQIKNGSVTLKVALPQQRRSRDRFYAFAGLFDRGQFAPDLAAGRKAESRWIVGALQPVESGRPTASFRAFLKPMRALGVSPDKREYRFSPPSNAPHVVPTFVMINVVSERKNPATQGVTRNVLWSAMAEGSVDSVRLPDLGRPVLPIPAEGERFLWEVIAVRAEALPGSQEKSLDLQSSLRNLQHVSSLAQSY